MIAILTPEWLENVTQDVNFGLFAKLSLVEMPEKSDLRHVANRPQGLRFIVRGASVWNPPICAFSFELHY
jgi:hypothetical protein